MPRVGLSSFVNTLVFGKDEIIQRFYCHEAVQKATQDSMRHVVFEGDHLILVEFNVRFFHSDLSNDAFFNLINFVLIYETLECLLIFSNVIEIACIY
jgi:hypothetical protein